MTSYLLDARGGRGVMEVESGSWRKGFSVDLEARQKTQVGV